MDNILEQTLAALSVRHTKPYVAKVYEDDPDRDNLLGVSRMLRLFGIETTGYMCDDVEMLFCETNPFVAAMGRSFSLVMSIDKEHAMMRGPEGERRIETCEFLNEWTGAVLLLEKKPGASEPDIEKHIRYNRNELIKGTAMALSLVALVIMGGCNLAMQSGIGECLLFVLNIIATSICVLLLEKQIKGNSKLGDKVCSTFKKGGCDSILNSDAAKPFLSMSWSEIGLGYFMTNIMLTMFVPESIPFMEIILLLSLLVSIWNLGYQAIRKKWCPLCVMVQACVVLQCLDVLMSGGANVNALNPAHIWMLLVYLIIIMTVHYVVRYAEEYDTNLAEMQRLKSIVTDEAVFSHLLKQQKHYEVFDDDSSVIIGNPEAQNKLTIFSNPHCEACSDTHMKLSLLLRGASEYKIQYIFTSFDDRTSIDSRFLISCFFNENESFVSLLDEWFGDGKDDPASFIHRHGGFHKDIKTEDQYAKHKEWARVNRMKVTPTVLFNGYVLPEGYTIGDLKYISLE